jgi:hypothetical protein
MSGKGNSKTCGRNADSQISEPMSPGLQYLKPKKVSFLTLKKSRKT